MLITRLSASNAFVGGVSPGFNGGGAAAASTGDGPRLSARSSRKPVSVVTEAASVVMTHDLAAPGLRCRAEQARLRAPRRSG